MTFKKFSKIKLIIQIYIHVEHILYVVHVVYVKLSNHGLSFNNANKTTLEKNFNNICLSNHKGRSIKKFQICDRHSC